MRPPRSLLVAFSLVAVAACTSAKSPVATKSSGASTTTAPANSAASTSIITPDATAAAVPDTAVVPTDPQTTILDWSPCQDDIVQDAAFQCATLAVPLDHADPSGVTLDLALIRLPATADDRIGAILLNPGGPGGSGFDFVAQAGTSLTSEMGLEQFDVVGFDPRGVDRSGGLRCQTSAEIDHLAYLDDTPDTPAEQALLAESDSAFATSCNAKYGDTLGLYSTGQTANDMDAIRIALGDEQISYIGISYGTYLGAVYASLFPEHVRAMVLDSAYEPGGDTVEQQYETQLVGFEGAFNDWVTWCTGNAECPFGAASSDVGTKWDALRVQLDEHPIIAGDGRAATQALLDSATFAALYSKVEWPVLGAALAAAEAGDAAGLFRLADSYSGREPDGTYNTIGQSNPIISCASGIESELPPDPEALAAKLRAVAPRFGKDILAEDFAKGGRCIELMAKQPVDVLDYEGDAPIVVIGGKNDPATPYRWAQEMTAAMGSSASLVTYTGEGHGQILTSTCVTEAEAAVIVSLTLPERDAVCDPDPEIAAPEWWVSLPVPDGIDPVLNSPELLAALGIDPTQLFGEIRTTALPKDTAISNYTAALDGVGFTLAGEQEPFPGVPQTVYQTPDETLLSVLVIDSAAIADNPQFESLAPLVPEGKTLVLLLALTQ